MPDDELAEREPALAQSAHAVAGLEPAGPEPRAPAGAGAPASAQAQGLATGTHVADGLGIVPALQQAHALGQCCDQR